MSLLSAAKNFLPLRGADRMAPCGAGNLFDGEARAKKWLQKCARAESTRLVALLPKIKVRCANAAGITGAAGAGGKLESASLAVYHPLIPARTLS